MKGICIVVCVSLVWDVQISMGAENPSVVESPLPDTVSETTTFEQFCPACMNPALVADHERAFVEICQTNFAIRKLDQNASSAYEWEVEKLEAAEEMESTYSLQKKKFLQRYPNSRFADDVELDEALSFSNVEAIKVWLAKYPQPHIEDLADPCLASTHAYMHHPSVTFWVRWNLLMRLNGAMAILTPIPAPAQFWNWQELGEVAQAILQDEALLLADPPPGIEGGGKDVLAAAGLIAVIALRQQGKNAEAETLEPKVKTYFPSQKDYLAALKKSEERILAR